MSKNALDAIKETEDIDLMFEIGREFAKGVHYREIAEKYEIPTREVTRLIDLYKKFIAWSAKSGGSLTDKIGTVIAEVDEHYGLIVAEAWINKARAEDAGSVNGVNQSLKLIADVQKNRATLFQQMANDADAELMAQLEESNRRQEQIINILRRLKDQFPQAALFIRDELSRLDAEVEIIQTDE